MAAVLGRTQIEIKRTTSKCSVPDNPTAKLMYYFNCVCSCIEAESDYATNRLRNYSNYHALSSEEEAKLLILCLALSPDKLIGTIFFPAKDEDLTEFSNEFFEVSAVNTKLVVAQSLLIGGQQKKVQKIMMFKKSWIENNYLNPLRSFERRQRPSQQMVRRPPPRRNQSSCVIL